MSPYVRTRSLGTAAILCLVATGCALQQLESLEAARLAYTEAAEDQTVAANAPVALYEAKQALTRAETAWEHDEDEVETTHLAYVARRRVEIARAVASEKQAEIEAGTLAERRAKVLLEAREAELAALKARKTDRGVIIPVEDVLFEFGRAELRPEARSHLARIAALLRDYPERDLLVEGHTDDVGSDTFNVGLSERRAASVLGFLAAAGISPRRMAARGLGESQPLATNATDEGRSLNRRVELVVLNEG
jgi:outer membrane protein OmpA-like peptidoglycan-associated protein